MSQQCHIEISNSRAQRATKIVKIIFALSFYFYFLLCWKIAMCHVRSLVCGNIHAYTSTSTCQQNFGPSNFPIIEIVFFIIVFFFFAGYHYAMATTKMVIAHTIRNYRLTTPLRFNELKMKQSITYRLLNKHLIQIHSRNEWAVGQYWELRVYIQYIHITYMDGNNGKWGFEMGIWTEKCGMAFSSLTHWRRIER